MEEYTARVQSSEGTKEVSVPLGNGQSYKLRYAYVSQRGYYPEALDKANQDSFCALPKFGGKEGEHFFGVFDGHGELGTPCSHFAREKVPDNLLKDRSLLSEKKFTPSTERTYTKAFMDTNAQLHRFHVDDSMSGTTAITVHVRGDKALVANVGDSRATAAEFKGKKLTAVDLSNDQTPFRADECARVKRSGARVLTLDQLEGLKDPNIQCWGNEEDDDGDPPRLWAANGMYPGTAFTRSIGDSAAERLGVFAEPEIQVYDITSNTSFIVLASDGVFEFLPSQTVCDMVSMFNDPHEACLAVVAESYRLWLQYETRTDDITMIVIQVKDFPQAAGSGNTRNSVVMQGQQSSRPVRRVLSKAKRAAIESSIARDTEEANWTPPKDLPKKTDEQYKAISTAVRANFLFAHLTPDKRQLLFDLMTERKVKKGDVLINEGEDGDYFYVVDNGTFEVYIRAPEETSGLGKLVHTYQVEGTNHPAFGELALMYNKPRAASVVAKTDGVLWSLDRRAFKAVMRKTDTQVLMGVLRSVPVLQSLNSGQLQRVADKLHEEDFEDGKYILRQGDQGDNFYIIQSGEVVCTVRKNPSNPAEQAKEVLQLGPNMYFGERALLSNAKRAANVIAKGNVRVLCIGRDTFEEVLGPLQYIINADRKWRERAAQHQEAVARRPSVAVLKSLNPLDIEISRVIYATDCTQVVVGRHRTRNEIMTLKMTSLSAAVELERQDRVARERALTKSVITPMPFIPSTLKSVTSKEWAATVLHTNLVTTFEGLISEGKTLSEESAVFYAASMILALEHCHMENLVFRGISPDCLGIDEDGYLAVVDFRFAKQLDERSHTLCGNPEYLAPEMVEGTGHNSAVDFWALGVFIYYMLDGSTPFAQEGDDELKVYRNITDHQYKFPSRFSADACQLIDGLLKRNPDERLGYSSGGMDALRSQPFFAHLDWSLLESVVIDQDPVPAEIKEILKGLEHPSVPQLEKPKPYDGPTDWLEDF